MSRIFTFVFILFATLSIVNAAPFQLNKRDTQFSPCPDLPPDVVPLDVKMSPDPIVPGGTETFDITGTLKHDLEEGSFLGIAFIDPVAKLPIGDPLDVDICSQTKCPVKAGTPYTTKQTITAPPELPPTYMILAGIGDGTPPNLTPYACEYALV